MDTHLVEKNQYTGTTKFEQRQKRRLHLKMHSQFTFLANNSVVE
jgi:hypothetical protein